MPPASKSSASSATRKKHARKAAGSEGSNIIPQNTKSKPSKKEIKKGLAPPPKKSYIPPSKFRPPPPQTDPLDNLGSLLPAELVVILRRLAKKDAVTKGRALEELEVWIRETKDEHKDIGVDSEKIQVLVLMLPIWLHRYPALCVHPSRRIRHLTASLHVMLLEIPDVRDNIIMFLQDSGPEVQVSQILGSWCLSAWDVDRGVALTGTSGWNNAVFTRQFESGTGADSPRSQYHDLSRVVLDDVKIAQSLLPFITTTILDPSSTFLALNPSPSMASSDSATLSRFGTPGHTSSGTHVRNTLSREEQKPLISRPEDDPESVEDRNARIRVAAIGALKWVFDKCTPTPTLVLPLGALLSSSMFWTILYHDAHPPFHQASHMRSETGEAEGPLLSLTSTTQGFGFGQTIVRRAGWGIVHTLMGGGESKLGHERWRAWISQAEPDLTEHTPSAPGLISSAILRSAFVELDPVVRSCMWEPFLMFLTKINNAWLVNCEYESSFQSKSLQVVESNSVSGSAVEGTVTTPTKSHPKTDQDGLRSAAYAEFLAFLSLGCNGSPLNGYPTLIVILSTIPGEILHPTIASLSGFFDALWSAIDGHALSTLSSERARSAEAFLGAWAECLVWTTRKLIKSFDGSQTPTIAHNEDTHPTDGPSSDNESQKEVSRALINLQFGKLVGELCGALRVEAYPAGVKVSVIFEKMEGFASDLLDEAWVHISSYARTTIFGPGDEVRRQFALSFLAALHQHLRSDASRRRLEVLISGIADEALRKCLDHNKSIETNDETLMTKEWSTIEILLDRFGSALDHDEVFNEILDNYLTTEMPLLISQPSLVLSYLKYRAIPARRLLTWHLLLSAFGSSSLDLNKRVTILNTLLAATHQGGLAWATPSGKELQGFTEQLLAEAFNGSSVSSSMIISILKTPGPFIDASAAQDLVSSTVTTIESHISPLIRTSSTSYQILRSSLNLILALTQDVPSNPHTEVLLANIWPRLFVLAFVVPHCSSNDEELEAADLARKLWKGWKDRSDKHPVATVTREVRRLLSDLLTDTAVRPRPLAALHALTNADVDIQPLAVIPSLSEFDTMLKSTSTDPIDGSLAILEPLVSPFTMDSSTRRVRWNRNFDNSGFSPYARGVTALLHVLTTDRHIARENMWALRHALTLALFASEVLQVPGAESPVFRGQQVAASELKEITRLAQQVASFLLTNVGEGSWHQVIVDVLLGKAPLSKLDTTGEFVRLVFEQSKLHDTVRDSLVLHTVLQHVLRNATKEDSDRWVELARSVEDQALQTSLAISLAVIEVAPEPSRLDRYRNELASKLSGIPPSMANTTGFRILRCLSAVAPDPESDVIFLPQQRAVFVVQTLQAWMGSDEDLEERVESEVTLVLFNLVPILQSIQGAHWGFILDLIESNLENSTFDDSDGVVILSRTLRLLTIILDLTFSNKYLRVLWEQRSKTILVLIRDLLAAKTDQMSLSVPRAICREQALSVLQGIPRSLMDENTLSTMYHLLTDVSVDNQKMAYQMLQQAAVTRTEHLVVEAGVDSESMVTLDLPHELVALLQSNVNLDDAEAGGQDPLAYLLGWMIIFDLFTDISLKVKTAYIDHLRTLDLIGGYFLPNVFEILGVGRSGNSFKLDPWVVDEYWLPLYDADAPPSLHLLAAHLYYRALLTIPSLVRTWWEELKDRQFSAAIAAFTSSYFSPVLIASELIHVKPSSRTAVTTAADGALNDETFNVRVALAVNEVTATFTVDDQQMEIGIKLPVGYPLKPVDVRPIRRVGVPEKVWRKWLFVVQQVVTSHNGRIVDGLALFKKTVSLHFEGQVECAICYSIIHVVDRSLPTKPCKTCKNRFHAGCLYKWFNTSHSSSCPLCRSDIM
ncbi:hypothetical protein JB92DRAFT_2851839 [Gautieria morchelliformis]|nr:hypothetical protein JB92DRAFT_2851839 [Gautieria morchelliformis]